MTSWKQVWTSKEPKIYSAVSLENLIAADGFDSAGNEIPAIDWQDFVETMAI